MVNIEQQMEQRLQIQSRVLESIRILWQLKLRRRVKKVKAESRELKYIYMQEFLIVVWEAASLMKSRKDPHVRVLLSLMAIFC